MPKKRVEGRSQRRRTPTTPDSVRRDAAWQARKAGCTAAGRRRLIRKIIGWSLISFGLLVVASHLVVHLGNIARLPTTGMQDLLTGYPMGGLLLIGGMITASKEAVT